MLATRRCPIAPLVAGILLAALLVAPASFAQVSSGNADFSRFVSIGDSLTAGFISSGLVNEVQRVSYPAVIYSRVNGTSQGFEQPLVSPPGIPAVLQLRSLSPLVIAPGAGAGVPQNLNLPRPYDNLAVPGATVGDAVNTVSDGGGLHDLILRGLGTQLQQAIALQPTFATVWIGNNDALGAATSGIVIDGVTLTPLASFEASFRTLTGALAGSGVQMALATIPDVTSIPFVTTVPAVVVDPATNQPVLANGNVVPLIGPNGPLTPGRDFVLLPATAELAQGRGIPTFLGGTGQGLSDQSVLSANEVAVIGARVNAYNAVIRTVANETGSALVDVNQVFRRIAANGLVIGGIDFTTEFLSGGLFSLDGVHATPLGYAVVANEFITAINATYSASIPQVSYNPYVFGPLAGLSTGFPVASPSSIVFTRQAENQLREVQGLPDRPTLAQIKRDLRNRPNRPNSGGDGGIGGGRPADDGPADDGGPGPAAGGPPVIAPPSGGPPVDF